MEKLNFVELGWAWGGGPRLKRNQRLEKRDVAVLGDSKHTEKNGPSPDITEGVPDGCGINLYIFTSPEKVL